MTRSAMTVQLAGLGVVLSDGVDTHPVIADLHREATTMSWTDRTLAALRDAVPLWVADPDDRTAALVTAMAAGVDQLDESEMKDPRVAVALGELASACEAALWIATGEGPR